jgi:oligopeptide transport system substrate-binding protein
LTVSDDGLQVAVQIGDGYFWHDGVAVGAADFVFAWESARLLGLPSSHLLSSITDAHAASPRRLEFTLASPVAHLPYLLSIPPSFPWPQHLGLPDLDAPDLRVKPLGNGPYLVSVWEAERIVLESTPVWTHGRGNVRRVEVELADHARRASGSASVGPRPFDIDINLFGLRHRDEDQALIRTTRVHQSSSLVFQTGRAPLNDGRVRRALALAIDRSALDFRDGSVPATGGFIPPSLPGHLHDSGVTFDFEQAAALLAEAGYPDGAGLRPIKLLEANDGPETRSVYEGVVNAWAALGIEVEVKEVAFRAHDAAVTGEGCDIFLLAWIADFPDPEGMIGAILNTYAGLFDNDQTAQQLIQRARASRNRVERFDLYRQLDQWLVADQVALVPLSYGVDREVVQPWVHGHWHTAMYRATADELMIVGRPGSSA